MKILSWHFPLGFCQKGGLRSRKRAEESNVLLWFICVSSLQHPPTYRALLEDVTRLETLFWPILCRLTLARSSVIELGRSFIHTFPFQLPLKSSYVSEISDVAYELYMEQKGVAVAGPYAEV